MHRTHSLIFSTWTILHLFGNKKLFSPIFTLIYGKCISSIVFSPMICRNDFRDFFLVTYNAGVSTFNMRHTRVESTKVKRIGYIESRKDIEFHFKTFFPETSNIRYTYLCIRTSLAFSVMLANVDLWKSTQENFEGRHLHYAFFVDICLQKKAFLEWYFWSVVILKV